jgi:hypothetical protein
MGTEMTVAEWPVAAVGGEAHSHLAEDLEIEGDLSSTGTVDIMDKISTLSPGAGPMP